MRAQQDKGTNTRLKKVNLSRTHMGLAVDLQGIFSSNLMLGCFFGDIVCLVEMVIFGMHLEGLMDVMYVIMERTVSSINRITLLCSDFE